MPEIYALYSARNGVVRYIGKTKHLSAERFEQHKQTQIGRYVTRVNQWLRHEWQHGFPVQYAVLEKCDEDSCDLLEKQWINRFPNLLNERSYFYNGKPAPKITEVTKYMRSHRFNCGGFRGICWWADIDQYTVLLPNGDWLPGDAAPGWGGSIFFLDRTAAYKAKELHQKHRPYQIWLPDFSIEVDC